ncbi:MAG: diadenylate cyclase CdaA [Acidobacteriota bacterium]
MFDFLLDLVDVEGFGWQEVLDILLVAVIVYGVIALLRRTRSAPVAIGIVSFLVIWRAAIALELETVGTLLDLAASALPIVVVLLFQNPIRRALLSLGRNPLFQLFATPADESVVEAVSLAMLSLSSQRQGALVAIERELGLRTYADSGIPLDARVSYELLLALFHPRSPLHDGCVILSQDRIRAAGCLLPLTTRAQPSMRLGSRHRAAIGLSEETDAIVIVVSEERGHISIVRDGELRIVEARELRDELRRELIGISGSEPRPVAASA